MRCELKISLLQWRFYPFQTLRTFFQKKFTTKLQHFTVIKLEMNHWSDDECANSMNKLYVIVNVLAASLSLQRSWRTCLWLHCKWWKRQTSQITIFFFLQNLNSFLVDNRFRRNDDLKDCVRRWLCELAVEMYEWRYMQNSYNVRTSIGMGLVVVLKNNLIYILFISKLFISGDIDPDQI